MTMSQDNSSLAALKTEEINEFLLKAKNTYHQVVDAELDKINKLILDAKKQKREYYLVLDIVSHKPKYGEVILAMQLGIILKILGIDLKCFIFTQDPKKHALKEIISADEVMLNLLADIYPIANFLLGYAGIDYEFIENIPTQNCILRDLKDKILFADQLIDIRKSKTSKELLKRPYNFYSYNQELLQVVLIKYNFRLKTITKPWLIGDIMKTNFGKISKVRLDNTATYFATNFRYNLARNEKNSNAGLILHIAKLIWNRYKIKTLVLTNKGGYTKLLKSEYWEKGIVVFANPGSFIDESCASVQTKFLYQIQGGGITMWHVWSSMLSYLIQADPGKLIEYKKESYCGISDTNNQVFISTRDYNPNLFFERLKFMIESGI